MAPEQWYGEPGSSATDVWALGVMLFEMFAGFRPFNQASPLKQAHLVCSRDAAPPLEMPDGNPPTELSDLVRRCLNKGANKRPDISEVVEILERLLRVLPSRLSEEQGPYRGLLPFDQQHAELYFGRDAECAAAAERLRVESSLAVVGASGSGKSSFVCAGLLPRLREQSRCTTMVLRPGRRPFEVLAARLREEIMTRSAPADEIPDTDNLAQSLRDAPTRLGLLLRDMAEEQRSRVILVIDQLEELHTHVASNTTRERFLQALEAAAEDPREPVRIIVTLRDDFLGKVAAGEHGRYLLSRVMVLRSPREKDLEQILEKPASVFGYRFEPGLAAEMIKSVKSASAALPLLQFAAQSLWEQRDRQKNLLCSASYQKMGGVAGALASHGDSVLETFSAAQRDATRQLFSRLVNPDGTRRVLSREKLLDGLSKQAPYVLDRLVASRLITTRGGQEQQGELEIAHESLIRCWARLARWLDENREDRIVIAELEQAAEQWSRRGERDEQLWRGESLRDAVKATSAIGDDLSQIATTFLERGLEAQKNEALKNRRRRTRLRAIAVTIGVGVLAILLAWNITVRAKEREARYQERSATARASQAMLESAKLSRLAGRLFEARAKLRAALELGSPEGADNEWWQLHNEPRLWSLSSSRIVNDSAFAPDSRRIALAYHRGPTVVLDARERLQTAIAPPSLAVSALAFSPDGKTIALGTEKGRVLLHDLASGKRTALGKMPNGKSVERVAFHADRELFAANRGHIQSFDWKKKKQSLALALDGGGQLLTMTRGPDGQVVTGHALRRGFNLYRGLNHWKKIQTGTSSPFGLAISPDRRFSFHNDHTSSGVITHLDLPPEKDNIFSRHKTSFPIKGVFSATEFSPDGKLLVVATQKSILLMETGSFRVIAQRSTADADAIQRETWAKAAQFSPDGKYLMTTHWSSGTQLWLVERFLRRYRTTGGHWGGSIIDAGTRTMASVTRNGRANLWHIETGQFLRELPHKVYSLRYSQDGSRLAIGTSKGQVIIHDQQGRELAGYQSGHEGGVMGLDWTKDGRFIATTGMDRHVVIGSSNGGVPLMRMRIDFPGGSIALHPDQTRVAVGRYQRRYEHTGGPFKTASAVYELGKPKPLLETRPAMGHIDVQFSAADGKQLLTLSHPMSFFRAFSLASKRRVATRGALALVPGGYLAKKLDRGPTCAACNAVIFRGAPRFVRYVFGAASPISALAVRHGRVFAASSGYPGPQSWKDGKRKRIALWRAMLLRSARLYTRLGVRDLRSGKLLEPKRLRGWERAVTRARVADMDHSERYVCLQRFNGFVEQWDTQTDKRLFSRIAWLDLPKKAYPDTIKPRSSQKRPKPTKTTRFVHGKVLRAEVGRCLLSASPWLVSINSKHAKQLRLPSNAAIGNDVRTIGKLEHLMVIVAKTDAVLLDERKRVLTIFGGPTWPTAAGGNRNYLTVGDRHGRVHVKHHSDANLARLKPRGRSPVKLLAILDNRLLIAGFQNGLVRIWLLPERVHVFDLRLTGIPRFVESDGSRAFIADHRGDWLTLPLGGLLRDSCSITRQLRKEVAVIWQKNGFTKPPAATRCKSDAR
jgi:WD40 repeat protein